MTDEARLFRECDRREALRRKERNKMADDVRAIAALNWALRDFNLFAPIETKTERVSLSLGWACLFGCVVFGVAYGI